MTPSRASRRPTLSASTAICDAYSGSAGKWQPKYVWPCGAAEHLVVRRHDVDLARRADPELDARAPEVLALDPLLDDPALLVERREVLLDVDLLVLELDRRARGRVVCARRRRRSAFPRPLTPRSSLRTAVVAAGCAELAQRAGEIVRSPRTSSPARVRHALVGEHAAGCRSSSRATRAPDRRRRSGAASALRELDLVARSCRTGAGSSRSRAAPTSAPDPLDRARTREQLPRQRLVAAVDERDRLRSGCAPRACRARGRGEK